MKRFHFCSVHMKRFQSTEEHGQKQQKDASQATSNNKMWVLPSCRQIVYNIREERCQEIPLIFMATFLNHHSPGFDHVQTHILGME